ncbi:MAG: prepilin-type N-terminal cleavage/methylation domain-containing protein [Phycisphaerae bacterium]|jgi:prepilin-type N-terminal cleavage/methylation domain-containing protein
MAEPHATRRGTSRSGFTLVEVLFSVLILGVLIGLLFVAFRTTRRYASSVTDRAAVNAVKMGLGRFVEECGIVPPLVRDRAAASPRTVVAGGAGAASRFSVYDFSPASTDLAALRDVTFPAASDANPFADARYSERTLPVYLAGECDYPLGGGAASDVPIDGIRGPGFYKAKADGSFDVPATLRAGGTPGGRTGGSKIDSLLDASKSYLQVVADPADRERVELLDKKKVPVRFYRWVNGAAYPQGARTVYEVRTLDDLRLPRLVGRKGSAFPVTPADRDIEKNPELRDAAWAIVAAGPDGAFGDEPIAVLSQRLGRPVLAADERKVRLDAEKDNVVEVGR